MANLNTNSLLTDSESGCIAGNLPLKLMRVAMENKGLLEKAGSLYCGTGKVNSVTIKNMSQSNEPLYIVYHNDDNTVKGKYKVVLGGIL